MSKDSKEIKLFDRIWATFAPSRVEDVVPLWIPLIGSRRLWEAQSPFERGDEWLMFTVDGKRPFGCCSLSHLKDIAFAGREDYGI